MKIFFNASLRGKREYGTNYDRIVAALKKTEHKLLASPVVNQDLGVLITKTDTKEAGNYYQQLLDWIKKADVCVFEVSYPSTSIGHEVALALQYSKPVVALHVKKAPANLVLESIKDDKFQLVDYSEDNISQTVADAIEYATEQMDTRFNFFISPDIGNYLDWVSKVKKIPRAVFLRQLIEEDMKVQGYDE